MSQIETLEQFLAWMVEHDGVLSVTKVGQIMKFNLRITNQDGSSTGGQQFVSARQMEIYKGSDALTYNMQVMIRNIEDVNHKEGVK